LEGEENSIVKVFLGIFFILALLKLVRLKLSVLIFGNWQPCHNATELNPRNFEKGDGDGVGGVVVATEKFTARCETGDLCNLQPLIEVYQII
jgi:hypothetical protein